MAGSSAPRRGTEAAEDRARSNAWSRLAVGAVEVLAVLLLALVFFGGFLVLLGAVFPAGESLRELALEGRHSVDVASFGERAANPAVGPDLAIASLDVLRPDVRRRASETIAWGPAHDGQPLHDRDAVQTGAEGRALVRFDASNELHLERNSFVVVMAPRPGPAEGVGGALGEVAGDSAAVTNASVRRGLVLVEGELLAMLQAPEQTRLELSLPNVVARLTDTTSRAPAKFRVTVREDHSATVAVLDGRLDLESRSGVVSVGPRQFSRVTPEGDVSPPRALPGAPTESAPAAGSTFAQLDLPPRVTFAWSEVPGASQYRLRAARDPEFRDVALDETVVGDSLTWGRAKPGNYWWQVAGVVDDVEGIATRPRTVVVRREVLPPQLHVEPPPRVVHEPRLVLRGVADSRVRVYVMGRPADVGPGGDFQIELALQLGANVVVVEAVDAAGHTAYWSQVVHVKP